MAVQKTTQQDKMSGLLQEYLTEEGDGVIFFGDAYQLADAIARFYFGVVAITGAEKIERQMVLEMILIPVTVFFNNPFYMNFEHEFTALRTQLTSAYLSDDADRFVSLIGETLAHVIFLANGRNIARSTDFHKRLMPVLWEKRDSR